MDCITCDQSANWLDQKASYAFCTTDCQAKYYSFVNAGFFDDNPIYTQSQDMFWTMLSVEPRPGPTLIVAGLRRAVPETKQKVLRWLLNPTAPTERVFGKSPRDFHLHLFTLAGKQDHVEMAALILKESSLITKDDFEMRKILKIFFEKNKHLAAQLLLPCSWLRYYNEELQKACELGNDKTVDLLLREGLANPAHAQSACLLEAVWGGHHRVVWRLLINNRVNIDDQNYNIVREAVYGKQYNILSDFMDSRFRTRPSKEKWMEILQKIPANETELIQRLTELIERNYRQ